MTTNYIFGVGRVQPSNNIKVNLSPTTTAAVNNNLAAPKPIAQQARPQQQTDVVSTIKTNNSAIDNFDDQINQLTFAKVNRQRQEQQTAQNQQSNAVLDTSQFSGPATGARAYLVNKAVSLLGEKYAWGGGGPGVKASLGSLNGPNNKQQVVGVDCSGLTSYAYSTIGIRLPHQSDTQLRTSGYKTNVRNLVAGDLVGWSAGGHVAMYIGNGQIVESVAGGPRVRSLSSNDLNKGVYGVHVSLPGD